MAVRIADLETRFSADTRDLERGVRRAEQITQQSASRMSASLSSIGSGRGGFIPGLSNLSEIVQGIPAAGRLIASFVSPMTQAAEAGVRFNMTMENAQIGFEGIAGGAQKAGAHLKILTGFSDSKRLNFESVLRASQYMNVFGFQLDEHVPKLNVWGSAIAASGKMSEDALEGVVRAFGQIRSLGRVNAEEMNQLAERGIPAWELLAKAIGKSVAETRKLGEQGRLKGPQAVEAMTAMMAEDPRFKGQLERRGQTLEGRLTQFDNVRGRSLGLATKSLTEDISFAVEGALRGEGVAERMASGLNAAISAVSPLIKGTVAAMTEGDIVGGITTGLTQAKGAMVSAFRETIVGGFMDAMEMHSPSRVMINLGFNAAASFQQGFEQGMSAQRARLEKAAENDVVRAFFEAIKRVEGGAPNRIVGGGTFSDFSKHPNKVGFRGPAGPSTAAGSWQMTGTNWRRIAPMLGLNDFSERNQLLAALQLFDEAGGLDKLLAGDIGGAMSRAKDWAAVPGSHLPGRKVSQGTFMGHFQQALGQGGGFAGPVPVQVVNIPEFARLGIPQDARQLSKVPTLDASGAAIGYSAFDPLDDMAGAGDATAEWAEELTTTGDIIRTITLPPLIDVNLTMFEVLKKTGQLGPTAAQSFGQAAGATKDWAAEVISSGKEAADFLGITAKGAAGAFQDSWVSAFTNVEQGFAEMMRGFVIGFAQSLNQMVQQWAASELSGILGGLLKSIGGALVGGAFGGATGAVKTATMSGATGGFAGGFASGGFIPPGMWGNVHDGERVIAGRAGATVVPAKGQTVVNNNIYVTAPPSRGYTTPRSRHELALMMASALRN